MNEPKNGFEVAREVVTSFVEGSAYRAMAYKTIDNYEKAYNEKPEHDFDYLKLAERTSATGSVEGRADCIDRVRDHTMIRLLHGAMGLCTEVGELQDQLKRHIFYGAPLDLVNVAEEVGDLMWYIAEVLNSVDGDLLAVMMKNIEKLQKRFPNKFTQEEAINRDLAAEREVLEG